MPSPFPGMDPYLEGSEWVSVHTALSAEIARQLAPLLRPRYVARPMRRFSVNDPADIVVDPADAYPDVSVHRSGHRVREILATADTFTRDRTPDLPLRLQTALVSDEPQHTVEIRDVANRSLVTAIEVLSPSNKRGQGCADYVYKRQRILRSRAHLMEIDLLRQGRRVPMRDPLPAAPYFVLLSRAENRPVLEVWPIQLRDRLPVVPVPLLPGDDDAPLDLQAALTAVYDAYNYDLSLDYTRPPEIPLAGDDAAWAAGLLKSVASGRSD